MNGNRSVSLHSPILSEGQDLVSYFLKKLYNNDKCCKRESEEEKPEYRHNIIFDI